VIENMGKERIKRIKTKDITITDITRFKPLDSENFVYEGNIHLKKGNHRITISAKNTQDLIKKMKFRKNKKLYPF